MSVAAAGAVGAEAEPSGAPQTVAQQLAEIMAASGCDHLFTLMGAGNLWLVHHLDAEHGVAIHHLRHENGAIGAADGYARSTGRLGWATVTQGPGFTNTITAMLTADRGRSPMVLLVSDSSNLDPARFPFAGGMQALAPEALLDPLGILSVRADGADAGARLIETIERARTERRAIAFVMPAGLDKVTAEPLAAAVRAAAHGEGAVDVAVAAAEPSAAQVAAAADAVERVAAPLIVVGRGVVEADASAEVLELAELLGARVATSVPASGALGEHPAVIGAFGGFSIGETERLIERADCLIAVGVSLNTFQTRKGEFTRGRTVVRIDAAPTAAISTPADIVRRASVDPATGAIEGAAATVVIDADARAGASALVAELRARGRRPRVLEPLAPEGVARDDDRSGGGLLDPRVLSLELERLLPRRRRIVVDNGHFGAFPMLYLRHRQPRSLIWMPDFGAVGSALAASFASAVADPGTTSVLFIGDCGLYMTLGDLETVVRERVPLLVVCMNDGAAGSELVHMQDWGVPVEQAIFGYGDIAALAAGMGAQSAVVQAIDDLEPALASWDRSRGPFVVDARLTRTVRSPIYAHV